MDKATPGPWRVAQPWSGFSDIRGPNDELIFGLAAGGRDEKQPDAVCEANARLIAAAPDLVEVIHNFEITGPDADGLVWLVLHGNGITGRAMVNLGAADQLVAQVALHLEQDRRSALSKALGEGETDTERFSPTETEET